MKVLSAILFALLVFAGLSRVARADVTQNGQVIVARVGDAVITADDLERRLANVPAFQLRTLGKTPAEIKRAFLEKVMIREALFADGARAEGLEDREDIRDRVRGVMRSAMMSRVRLEASAKPVSDAEVKQYYEQNQAKFHAPARIGLWRIQVATEAEAKAILEDLARDDSPKRWSELAREKSVDKMTALRGGNLGFVKPDGSTDEANIKVDPNLFHASLDTPDGKIVSQPVKDDGKWSVVWRRQSMRPVDRSLESEAPSIKQILLHQHAEDAIQDQLKKLKEKYVTSYNPELVDFLSISGSGEISPARRPGALPLGRRTLGSPQPRETPNGTLR